MAQVLTDMPYGPDERHRLDLYLPERATPAPLFFFVHGGGWRGGDKSRYKPLAEVLVNFGYAVAAPNHRLAPQDVHPAHIEDVAAALGFLRRSAGESNIRMDRVCLAGHSSGGHLVSLLALHPGYLQSAGVGFHQIGGVISISGVYDLTSFGNLGASYLGQAFGPETHSYSDASPIFHVRPGTPPFFLAYAEHDYPGAKEQAEHFAAALKKHGGSAKVLRVEGRDHVSILSGVRSMFDPLAIGLGMFMRSIR